MSTIYEVFVDDNYHYMDERERYRRGAYPTCAAATAACRQIVDEYLRAAYRPGMTADALWQGYVSFGEDPFIQAPGDPACTFAAWDYARARCAALCAPAGPDAQ
ncbi:MAG TPA: hypothetical protein VKY74_26145 [Chloroflexia bacterium]|nr:hypothetical protein [Chloroflexia bacterium]